MKGSKRQYVKLAKTVGKKVVQAVKATGGEITPSMMKDIYQEKYRKSLEDAKAEYEDEFDLLDKLGRRIGKYSLRTRIKNNPWLKSGRPSAKAISWMFQEVFKDSKKYAYRQNAMFSGGLFTFEYMNPKFKGTKQLPWFDKYPLVLSLGPIVTKNGIRNLGFNLHLLPPKVRIVVICQVFEIYKVLYRYNIFFSRTRPVNIKYEYIMKSCLKYGAGFSVRMYIPQRQQATVLFPYTDWHKAIFLPSRGYDSIKAAKLIQEWSKYVRKLGYATSKNIDWKSTI